MMSIWTPNTDCKANEYIFDRASPKGTRNCEGGGGHHSTVVSILASGPSCPGLDSQRSQKKFKWKKLSMLLRLINVAA